MSIETVHVVQDDMEFLKEEFGHELWKLEKNIHQEVRKHGKDLSLTNSQESVSPDTGLKSFSIPKFDQKRVLQSVLWFKKLRNALLKNIKQSLPDVTTNIKIDYGSRSFDVRLTKMLQQEVLKPWESLVITYSKNQHKLLYKSQFLKEQGDVWKEVGSWLRVSDKKWNFLYFINVFKVPNNQSNLPDKVFNRQEKKEKIYRKKNKSIEIISEDGHTIIVRGYSPREGSAMIVARREIQSYILSRCSTPYTKIYGWKVSNVGEITITRWDYKIIDFKSDYLPDKKIYKQEYTVKINKKFYNERYDLGKWKTFTIPYFDDKQKENVLTYTKDFKVFKTAIEEWIKSSLPSSFYNANISYKYLESEKGALSPFEQWVHALLKEGQLSPWKELIVVYGEGIDEMKATIQALKQQKKRWKVVGFGKKEFLPEIEIKKGKKTLSLRLFEVPNTQ